MKLRDFQKSSFQNLLGTPPTCTPFNITNSSRIRGEGNVLGEEVCVLTNA